MEQRIEKLEKEVAELKATLEEYEKIKEVFEALSTLNLRK